MKICPECGSNNVMIFDADNDICDSCKKWFPAVADMQPGKPLLGDWRHGNGYVCCGSMRIFRTDIDTNPSEEYTNKLLDWVCKTLNRGGK